MVVKPHPLEIWSPTIFFQWKTQENCVFCPFFVDVFTNSIQRDALIILQLSQKAIGYLDNAIKPDWSLNDFIIIYLNINLNSYFRNDNLINNYENLQNHLFAVRRKGLSMPMVCVCVCVCVFVCLHISYMSIHISRLIDIR